jgi:pimeloyl-ACP methyl ester carboxylesterase
MEGTLWRWNSRGQVAFISADRSSVNYTLCLGGLTDGLYPCPWVQQLNNKCSELGWALVQPTLSGSYTGYGTGSLDRDVEELSQFILHLKDQWNCQRLVIVGHSTGCQIAIHLTNFASDEVLSLVSGIVLQAPVSDQEAGTLTPETAQYLHWARQQPPELLHTLMPIESHYSPITIHRYLSLFDRYGQDDYFSSYLTDQELQRNFSGILSRDLPLTKILIAYSMSDEYVPTSVDKSLLVDRLVGVLGPRAVGLKLSEANHNLTAPDDGSSVRLFIQAIERVFKDILLSASGGGAAEGYSPSQR